MVTNTLRSLQVVALALVGLLIYVAAFALIAGFCALLLSGYVHAVQTAVSATSHSPHVVQAKHAGAGTRHSSDGGACLVVADEAAPHCSADFLEAP